MCDVEREERGEGERSRTRRTTRTRMVNIPGHTALSCRAQLDVHAENEKKGGGEKKKVVVPKSGEVRT